MLVCGGRWHDFDFARRELLAALGDHPQVKTRVYETYECLPALAVADLLMTYTCDVRPDIEQQQALLEFVARGGRWLALHATNSAIDPPGRGRRRFSTPRVLGEVATVLGSQFLGHPPISPYEVQISQPDHPLVAGVQPFTVTDELYVSELHPPLDVILHARYIGACPGFTEGHTDDDEPRPVLYTRPHGAGLVTYFTLGHCRGRFDLQDQGIADLGVADRGSWDVREYRTILNRCVRWAVTGSV